MAGGQRTIAIRFTGDAKGLKSTSRTVQREVDGWRGKMQGFRATTAAVAVTVGALAVKFGKDSVTAYTEAEQAQTALQDAFARFPKLADTNIERLRTLNSRLAEKTRFDDDATASGQAVLAGFKLTGRQIETLTPLLQDYAQKTGKDLPSAAKVVGKALLGKGKALADIGLKFKDAGSLAGNFDQVIGGLRRQVGGYAEQQGKNAAGQTAILNNKFGEIQETVGGALLPVLMRLTSAFIGLASFVQRNAAILGPLAITLGTVALGVLAVNAALSVWSATTRAFTAVQAILNAVLAANPIGLVVLAIAALVAAFVIAYKKSAAFRDLINRAFTGVKAAAQAVARFFTGTLPGMFGAVMRAATAAGRWIIGRFSAMLGWLRGLPGRVGGAVAGLFNRARDLATDAGRSIRTQFDSLVGFFRGLPVRVGGAVAGMWDGLKTAFRQAVNWIIGKWNNLRLTIGGQEVSLPFGKSFSIPSITLNTPDIPYLAKGGAARAGRSYLVGEKGPELFTPGATGFVTPNNRLGGGDVRVTVLLDGRAIEPRMVKVIAEHDREIRRAVTAGSGG